MEQPRDHLGQFGRVSHSESGVSLGGPSSWPAGGWETYEWTGKQDAFRASRYLSGMTGQPYEAFVPPYIAGSTYLPSPGTAALAEEAPGDQPLR
jgi:hypothetical protein